MAVFKFTLCPQSAFATPLHGDTLFGQLCWTILRRQGEEKLEQLLGHYNQYPFAVVSDAFPAGYIPKPQIPRPLLVAEEMDTKTRILFKQKNWIPVKSAGNPLKQWMVDAQSDREILKDMTAQTELLQEWQQRMHNSINRLTGTTGENGFAPYSVAELWFSPGIDWEIYVVLDESQIDLEMATNLLREIGRSGYGKDASIGAGKFVISDPVAANLPHHKNANALLALAAVAPQGLPIKAENCFYQPFTRFGRHGDWAVLVNPYKAPILMAKTGAVLSPTNNDTYDYFGQALGGKGEISRTISATVHQGYAPVLRIALND